MNFAEGNRRQCSTHAQTSNSVHTIATRSARSSKRTMACRFSLFSALNEEDNDHWAKLPTFKKMQALKAVVAAVAYMHSVGLVHADLKPQNVLLAQKMVNSGESPTFWVSDFGLSQTASSVSRCKGSTFSESEDNEGTEGAGTIEYMAPETVLDSTKV